MERNHITAGKVCLYNSVPYDHTIMELTIGLGTAEMLYMEMTSDDVKQTITKLKIVKCDSMQGWTLTI